MSPYQFGHRSAATRALQQALSARNLYAGPVDGIFGHLTRDAVAAARAGFGLPPGDVDAALLDRLGLAARPAALPDLVAQLLLRQAIALFISHLKGSRMTFLSGYKTYIVAAAMLLTGIAGLVGVDIPNFTGQAPGNLVMEALAFLFLRQGLKSGN